MTVMFGSALSSEQLKLPKLVLVDPSTQRGAAYNLARSLIQEQASPNLVHYALTNWTTMAVLHSGHLYGVDEPLVLPGWVTPEAQDRALLLSVKWPDLEDVDGWQAFPRN